MKPHLPASLRRALIACLVALAPAAQAYDLSWFIYNIYWGVGEYFSDSRLFLPGDNVTFGSLPTDTTESVYLLGGLKVGSMTINAGEGNTYLFYGSGSITEVAGITVTSGTAEFNSADRLPSGGADVQITAGGKLKLGYGSGSAYHLDITLGNAEGSSAAELELNMGSLSQDSSLTLSGSLEMGDGSVLRVSSQASTYTQNLDIDGPLRIAAGDTASVVFDGETDTILSITDYSEAAGTLRTEGNGGWLYLSGGENCNLELGSNSLVHVGEEFHHADIEVSSGKGTALDLAGSNTSVSLHMGEGSSIDLFGKGTVDQLTGNGTLNVRNSSWTLAGGNFEGTIRLEGGAFTSAGGNMSKQGDGDASLILGSSDVAAQAAVELGEYGTCVYSLSLADGVNSAELKSLSGSAYSRIKAGSYRVREGGSFAGTLEDGVALTVGAGSTMDFAGARADDGASTLIVGEGGSTLANLTLGSGMVLGAQLAGTAQSVTLQNMTLESGGTILFDAQTLSANSPTYDMSGTPTLDVSGGGTVALVIDGAENLAMGDSYLLLEGMSDALQGTNPEQVFDVTSNLGSHLQYSLEDQSGDLVLVVTPTADYYSRGSLSHNGQAGAALADALFAGALPQYRDPGSDASTLMQQLDRLIESGELSAADNTMAAAAGASVTTLGMAFAADAQHRLNNIRDRISTLKLDSFGAPAGDPGPDGREPMNFWVNAEGGYLTLEQSGTAPGYSMTSWGGTVGVEGSPRRDLSCGLAFSALFGDLDADAADAASGDLDTYYLSAFGQYRSGAWKHTLVASLGLADISLNRTVAYGSGSYRTSGDTDGLSLGFLYEITRDIPLNGANTAILQPLVNVSYLHTHIDGYTESGSDAALRFGDQNLNSVSFGAGARVQALAGESLLNRSALFEARALAKFNAGDRRSTAGVSFANGFGQAAVESAAMGVFGMELGAGVTVPLGREAGSIFADVSYELYREYSSLNAGVGYRLNF